MIRRRYCTAMYVPAYAGIAPELMHAIAREHPFALLYSEVEGAPFATHLPLLLEEEAGSCWLRGPVAPRLHFTTLVSEPRRGADLELPRRARERPAARGAGCGMVARLITEDGGPLRSRVGSANAFVGDGAEACGDA